MLKYHVVSRCVIPKKNNISLKSSLSKYGTSVSLQDEGAYVRECQQKAKFQKNCSEICENLLISKKPTTKNMRNADKVSILQ